MMQIHYFQRYHSKENVDTSNTMLMLSRLYNYNSDKFFAMLNTLILDEADSPEICFELQVGGNNSVPDAIISQKSFKIVIETKLYNQFDIKQLVNHLEQFEQEEIKVLLTLDPKPMQKNLKIQFEKELEQYNLKNKNTSKIKHVNLTFEKLVNVMEDLIDERDTEIVAVLEDFKRYCFDEKLIPDGYKHMRAFTTGTTFNDNVELSLYYRRADEVLSEFGYVGLYNRKSIKAVGKVLKTVVAKETNGELEYYLEKGEEITNKDIINIKEAIKRSQSYDYDLKTVAHRYFIVDKFYMTDFRKNSKYAIQKYKDFNLANMLGYNTMPETFQIANDLDGHFWEEF